MDLKQLRTFIVVAEELNLRKAGERLHLSQPPITVQLNKLEEELGIKLLNRGRNKRISLTPAGKFFLADARLTLRTAENSIKDVQAFTKGQHGRLCFSYSDDFLYSDLAMVIAMFHKKYPEVSLSHAMQHTSEIISEVEEGKIDMGLVSYPIRLPDSRITRFELGKSRIVAVVPSDHELAVKSEIHASDLKDVPMYFTPTDMFQDFSTQLSRLFSQARVSPKILGYSLNPIMMCNIVKHTHGVALVSERSIPQYIEGTKILPLNDSFPYINHAFLYNPDNPNGTIITNFFNLLKETLAN